MNRTYIKNSLIVSLRPCQQSGADSMHPKLPQKDAAPDYLLVGDLDVTADAAGKKATLQFDTLED